MDPILGGALITGGAQLLSGVLGNRSSESAERKNRAMQREFAKHGISWRVADAKRAGLHPLAALGANIASPRAVHVGRDYSFLNKMGQTVASAMDKKYQRKHADVDLEIKKLEAERLRRTLPPKIPGQGDTDLTTGIVSTYDVPQNKRGSGGVKWKDVELEKKQQEGIAAGHGPLYQYKERPDGSVVMLLSKEAGDIVESDMPAWIQNIAFRGELEGKARHWLKTRNDKIMDMLSRLRPKRFPGKNKEWRYDTYKSAWYSRKRLGRLLVDRDHDYFYKGKPVTYYGQIY